MARDNLKYFEDIVAEAPDNVFARYALAMEYYKARKPNEALDALEELLKRDPAYVAAYQLGGRIAVEFSMEDRARDLIARGIDTAEAEGNSHAVTEMKQTLSRLDS